MRVTAARRRSLSRIFCFLARLHANRLERIVQFRDLVEKKKKKKKNIIQVRGMEKGGG